MNAFSLAIGLRAVRFGEEVFEAELVAGSSEEFGAVSGATIGQDALDGDAVGGVEGEGLLKRIEDTGSFFIWEERGEGETGVVVDGDVKRLSTPEPGDAMGAVAGGADPGLFKAAELLDIEMEEIAGGVAFVADDGRFGRFERGKAIEAVTAQDAGESGFGDRENQ